MAKKDGIKITLTGMLPVGLKFATMPAKLQQKAIRKAVRETGKVVLRDARANTPVESGAMKRSLKVRSFSRSIKRGIGTIKQHTNKQTGHTYSYEVKRVVAKEFGAKVVVDRESLRKHVENEELLYRKGISSYFYPAAVELGRRGAPRYAPMRHAMRSSQSRANAIFATELAKAISSL